MGKGHLKLVLSNENKSAKNIDIKGFLNDTRERLKCAITSKREKIYVLKDYLIKLYRDYEITTGFCDIPYYVRAELKISEIIQNDKVDYYFQLFEKIKKKTLISKL